MVAMAYSSPVIISNTVLVQERASLVIVPPAPQALTFVPSGGDSTLSIIDTVIYNAMAAWAAPPPPINTVSGQATNSSFVNLINRLPTVQHDVAPVVGPRTVVSNSGQFAIAAGSPVIIDNLVLYPARAAFVNPPTAAVQTINDGWIQPFPPFLPSSLRSVEWITSVSFRPPVVQPFGWEQPFPDVFRTQRPPAGEWSFTFITALSGASFGWYGQFELTRPFVNIASMAGAFTLGRPIVTNVLAPNISNWYIQYPIPPARGAINVASLIDGYTWSESALGGIIQLTELPHHQHVIGGQMGRMMGR